MNQTASDVLAGVDLRGRTAVITGATSGLGLESARALASAGASVVLAGRGEERLAHALATVRAAAPDATLAAVELDLTSIAGVRGAARRVREEIDAIDILMNNAGVMFTPFEHTADGFELQFGVNHLGHFEWTRRLLPMIAGRSGGRVVNVSSGGHAIADIDLADPNWERRPYDKFAAYGASKTANILFTVALDARLAAGGVRANAVHPGMVATSLARYMEPGDVERLMKGRSSAAGASGGAAPTRLPVLTPPEGAATQVWAAVADELSDVGGAYLADCAVSPDVKPYAVDPERGEALWRRSEELCAALP
ncbi:MAG TPA: SDR family NAD(P)-dependent oxidoreductase [Mycobacteriales bacterium]|nr:SDR family NAD(P)-dependent oxidoreductase [Mycobacteriales bacterium]